jgi:hypothetical protein
MLRSTLSYLSFGLVSETVENELASVVAEAHPGQELETRTGPENEIKSPLEDNWVILGQDLTEERPANDSVSVPVLNIDDRPSRRNTKKLAKRKTKDVLKVSTTNYSRDIRNEMGIRTIPTRKTTKLNKQMNKKVNQPISHKFQHCNK